MSTQSVTAFVPAWSLGDRLRKAREHRQMSQSELAATIAVTRNTIVNAETDRRRPLPITIRAWAAETGVSYSWILTGQGEPTDGPEGLLRLDSNQEPPGLRSEPPRAA